MSQHDLLPTLGEQNGSVSLWVRWEHYEQED
jgi:hypothetical protein